MSETAEKTPTNVVHRSNKDPKDPKPPRGPNEREKLFAMAIVKLRAEGKENKAEAARMAGYKGRVDTLTKAASKMLAKPQVQQLIDERMKEAETLPVVPGPLRQFRYIMGIRNILALTTRLASATLDDVLDDDGFFDIEKARRTGGIHTLSRLKITRTRRVYKNGTVDYVTKHEFALRDKNAPLELMGRHFDLWDGEIKDPLKVLSEMLNVPKHLLPTRLGDEPLTVPDELLKDDNLIAASAL